jgi:hypothetical protein
MVSQNYLKYQRLLLDVLVMFTKVYNAFCTTHCTEILLLY